VIYTQIDIIGVFPSVGLNKLGCLSTFISLKRRGTLLY
jgi:hypothetical protein